MVQTVEKTLEEMEIGESGQIIDLILHNQTIRHRMLDIGIAPFAKVQLIHTLHGKQLFIIDVDDVEVCIRREAAKEIMVCVG